jgi:hypothetical protein
MRRFLLSAALILIASSTVHATESLFFNGGGYTIQILVGYVDDPVVAQVLFTPPGAKDWVVLPREILQVEKFDMEKRVLTMHFSNKNKPICRVRFPFLSKGPGLSSLLAAKKLRVNSIGIFDAVLDTR